LYINTHFLKNNAIFQLPIIFIKQPKEDLTDSGETKPTKITSRLCPLSSAKTKLGLIKVTTGQKLTVQLHIGLPEGSAVNSEAPSKWRLHADGMFYWTMIYDACLKIAEECSDPKNDNS
jgi:hypothetical protein